MDSFPRSGAVSSASGVTLAGVSLAAGVALGTAGACAPRAAWAAPVALPAEAPAASPTLLPGEGRPPDAGAPSETRWTERALNVRASPSPKAAVIGGITPGAAFVVVARVAGEGCGGDGWGALPVGYACLADSVLTQRMAVDLPTLVPFDSPTPEEYRGYVASGAWPREPASTEALLPYVYAKRWRRWEGHNWASLEAWLAGEPPIASLEGDRKYHFVSVVETPRGAVLVREPERGEAARVVPLDDAFVYPVSRFAGVDLVADPVPAGQVQAWVHGYDGAPVYAAPEDAAKGGAGEAARLPHHAAVRVVEGEDARWLRIPGALGEGRDGYVAASAVRRMRVLPRPADVGPDEVWIDVDTDEQVLLVLRGDAPVRATLTSTGLGANKTPHGVYRVLDKAWEWDMESLPGAAEPYHVERVPWVVHFRPRYALHGVFWHWGFGNRASHGCVNLSPADAHFVFDAVAPALPAGWRSIRATAQTPGSTVRVRAGSPAVPDRR